MIGQFLRRVKLYAGIFYRIVSWLLPRSDSEYLHELVLAAAEEVGQRFLQARVVKVLSEDPVADAVPESTVGVVVRVLAQPHDVVPVHELGLELVPVDLRSFSWKLYRA